MENERQDHRVRRGEIGLETLDNAYISPLRNRPRFSAHCALLLDLLCIAIARKNRTLAARYLSVHYSLHVGLCDSFAGTLLGANPAKNDRMACSGDDPDFVPDLRGMMWRKPHVPNPGAEEALASDVAADGFAQSRFASTLEA